MDQNLILGGPVRDQGLGMEVDSSSLEGLKSDK